jgi:hypothetical protein
MVGAGAGIKTSWSRSHIKMARLRIVFLNTVYRYRTIIYRYLFMPQTGTDRSRNLFAPSMTGISLFYVPYFGVLSSIICLPLYSIPREGYIIFF